jgi:hypothetical protein
LKKRLTKLQSIGFCGIGQAENVLFLEKGDIVNRMVYRNKDGQWANKRTDADKAGSLHETQKEAQDAARTMLKREGGGELITKGRDGKINSKDTIAPGNDPCPPKDREH